MTTHKLYTGSWWYLQLERNWQLLRVWISCGFKAQEFQVHFKQLYSLRHVCPGVLGQFSHTAWPDPWTVNKTIINPPFTFYVKDEFIGRSVSRAHQLLQLRHGQDPNHWGHQRSRGLLVHLHLLCVLRHVGIRRQIRPGYLWPLTWMHWPGILFTRNRRARRVGDPGIMDSAAPSARPSLSVSVIGLLLAPVMNSVDQTPRKDKEVRLSAVLMRMRENEKEGETVLTPISCLCETSFTETQAMTAV